MRERRKCRLFYEQTQRNLSHEIPSGRKDINIENDKEDVQLMRTEYDKIICITAEFCEKKKIIEFSVCMEVFLEQLYYLSQKTACIFN